ncbi:MAG: thioesterase II family protein [Thermodesulfobacteriota bacterium]
MTEQQDPLSAFITRPRPNFEADIRLFCLPYAGGGTLIYRNWPDLLPAPVEVCPIRLPGRENLIGTAPFRRIGDLTEALIGDLIPFLDRPYAVFGHSMGALLGFELVRALRRREVPLPRRLLVSGCWAPQVPFPHNPLHNLPRNEFITRLREYGGTPEAVLDHAELMDLFVPVLRADFELVETYTHIPEKPLACPISAFGGEWDEKVSHEDLTKWAALTESDFKLTLFPGDHFFLHGRQAALAKEITRVLL